MWSAKHRRKTTRVARPSPDFTVKHSLRPRDGAFTLIELICVIVVIAVLASMLLPAIGKMTERATNIKCQNNLR